MLENPLRAALAEEAARRRAAGLSPEPVWAALRRLTVTELLGPAAPGCADLDGTLAAVCEAARAAARRRPGWFYAVWEDAPVLAVRPRLLTAAVCAALRGVLSLPGARGVLQAQTGPAGVLLRFQGGGPNPEARALWARMAQEDGGTAAFGAGAVFTAAARLPALPGPAGAPAGLPAVALLADRYSVLYQFLGPWAALPDG